MGIIEGVIAWVVALVMDIISAIGFPGIFGLMTLESMCVPVPSEVVLPFGGALVYMGRLALTGDPVVDTLLVAIVGTLGCTAGSVIAYFIGLKGGRPFVLRYGRYLRVHEGHLDMSERWFKKYGDWAIFGSRLLPVIRTFISLPAGMARMKFNRFVVLTTVGSFPWCLALSFIGYYLGENWSTVESLYRPLEIVVVLGVIAAIIYFVWKSRTERKVGQASEPDNSHDE
jgi:membrane protein DedA with SNARE-associated domain